MKNVRPTPPSASAPRSVARTVAGTPRMAAEDRRKHIVQVARHLFSQKGFDGTTTKEIAQRVGVSEAIIFRHFATKQDLYAAILDEQISSAEEISFWERIHELAAANRDRELFEALSRRMLEKHRRDDSFLRLLLYSALEDNRFSEMVYEARVKEFYAFLTGYIRRRTAEGAFRRVDPMLAARAFVGMSIYQTLTEQLFEKKAAKRSARDIAVTFTELFLTSVFPQGVAESQDSDARGRTGRREKRRS